MNDTNFDNITAEQLKQFIQSKKEKDYVLVDVRQPAEYTRGHIPGAKFIPLNQLMTDMSGLPQDRDLIFYCHMGGRSLAAATMAAEEIATANKVYNLIGGIQAWQGQTIEGYPKIKVFDKNKSAADHLLTAMDLEKGAWRFYTYVLENFNVDPIHYTLEKLSKAEIGHAKTVYGFWKSLADKVIPFDALYAKLEGAILEGGESLTDALDFLNNIKDNKCIRIIEWALHIEYAAFDLYRTMADNTDDPTARDAFLTIAQAEKNHMRILADALPHC